MRQVIILGFICILHIFADCCKGYGIEVYSSTNQSLANISDIYGIFEKHGYENDGKQYYQHPSKNLYIKFCYDTQWIITHGDDSDVCYYWDYFDAYHETFDETSEYCPEITDGKPWFLNVNGDFQSSTERVRFRCAGEDANSQNIKIGYR